MEKLLSIIIPAYNEEDNIESTAEEILKTMHKASINCEVIFVSDGSTDNTFQKALSLSQKDKRVKGIEFSRNFGKEAAITAGLEKGNGDCFVIMDCDLQHPPETIVEMYEKWEMGYEVVEGIKLDRGEETFLYKLFSNMFYNILSGFTGYHMKNTGDFKLIDKKVAEILINLPERKPFFRALSFWAGFKSTSVRYMVGVRNIGTSKWSSIKLIKYAVSNIISFSTIPLDIIIYIGLAFVFGGFISGIYTVVNRIVENSFGMLPSILTLILIFGGIMLIVLGLIARYISAIYEEIKHRPRYIVRLDTDNLHYEKK